MSLIPLLFGRNASGTVEQYKQIDIRGKKVLKLRYTKTGP